MAAPNVNGRLHLTGVHQKPPPSLGWIIWLKRPPPPHAISIPCPLRNICMPTYLYCHLEVQEEIARAVFVPRRGLAKMSCSPAQNLKTINYFLYWINNPTDAVSAIWYTICTIYPYLCTQTAETTSAEPFSLIPLYVHVKAKAVNSSTKCLVI